MSLCLQALDFSSTTCLCGPHSAACRVSVWAACLVVKKALESSMNASDAAHRAAGSAGSDPQRIDGERAGESIGTDSVPYSDAAGGAESGELPAAFQHLGGGEVHDAGTGARRSRDGAGLQRVHARLRDLPDPGRRLGGSAGATTGPGGRRPALGDHDVPYRTGAGARRADRAAGGAVPAWCGGGGHLPGRRASGRRLVSGRRANLCQRGRRRRLDLWDDLQRALDLDADGRAGLAGRLSGDQCHGVADGPALVEIRDRPACRPSGDHRGGAGRNRRRPPGGHAALRLANAAGGPQPWPRLDQLLPRQLCTLHLYLLVLSLPDR